MRTLTIHYPLYFMTGQNQNLNIFSPIPLGHASTVLKTKAEINSTNEIPHTIGPAGLEAWQTEDLGDNCYIPP